MINKEVELMIDKLCRCCMCKNENMHNLFEAANNTDEAKLVSLSEMLIACASVEVKSEDALPNTLCKACEEKLKSFYAFRILCQKSDSTLRDLTENDRKLVLSKEVQEDLNNDKFDDLDDLPILERHDLQESSIEPPVKRKRGRPKKNQVQPHTCTHCNKNLHTAKGLKIHLRSHTGDKIKHCLFCDAKYARTNHLMRHIVIHDKPGVKHPCEQCDKTFEAAADLMKHSNVHIEMENEKVKLEQEEIIFEDVPELIELEDISETINDVKTTISQEQTKENNTEISVEEQNTSEDTEMVDDFPVDDGLGDRFDESDGSEDLVAKNDEPTESKKSKKNDKIYFGCDVCSKVLSTQRGLKIHLRKHTATNAVECKLCNKSFSKRSHLYRHMFTHTKGDDAKVTEYEIQSLISSLQVMECEYCDRKFKYKKSFVNHMKVEHGISDAESDIEKEVNSEEKSDNSSFEKTVEGDETDLLEVSKTEIVPAELTNHQDSESVEKLIEIEVNNAGETTVVIEEEDSFGLSKKSRSKNQVCHVCNASFARVNHLTRHMILHRNVLVHQCERCDKAFATEEHLKTHVEDEHINKPYVCTVCNKPFSRGEHLIRHLKIHQSNQDQEKNLKCSICDQVFSKSDQLARHTKVHLLQDKRHVCIDCGKAFNRLDNLKTHQRVHTGVKDTSKLHLCIYCGKEFNNSSNMIVHMRRHTGERPYKCNECGKGFPRSHDLKCHERTHSGEKPYLCTLCGKSFNKSNKLLRHSRVHTGERPYVCNICGRAFTQSNDLSLHMRRHTGARPYACGVCPARFIQSGQLKAHKRTTGHWIETQPDLKGGHRVEPVTPAHEPMPIRFKSHKMKREEHEQTEPTKANISNLTVTTINNHQEVVHEEQPHPHHPTVTLTEVQGLSVPPQRILMGIMGNIKLQNEPLLIDSTKLVELHSTGLMNLPSVIQTANGEEIKLKSEVANFTLTQCDDVDIIEKQEEEGAARVFEDGTVIYSSVGHTSTTYTVSENFNFHNYH